MIGSAICLPPTCHARLTLGGMRTDEEIVQNSLMAKVSPVQLHNDLLCLKICDKHMYGVVGYVVKDTNEGGVLVCRAQ